MEQNSRWKLFRCASNFKKCQQYQQCHQMPTMSIILKLQNVNSTLAQFLIFKFTSNVSTFWQLSVSVAYVGYLFVQIPARFSSHRPTTIVCGRIVGKSWSKSVRSGTYIQLPPAVVKALGWWIFGKATTFHQILSRTKSQDANLVPLTSSGWWLILISAQ